jgi:membrane protein YdbS with pleckstrin-like domain
MKAAGTEERTLARCETCQKATWQRKRKKTEAERRQEFEDGIRGRVYLSSRAWWASLVVWSSAALVWSLPLFLVVEPQDPAWAAGISLAALFAGWIGPWFWLTTRYRITDQALHVNSGPFHVELDLIRIQEVSERRKSLGMSFALDTKFLWVGYPMAFGAVLVSPRERELFLRELAEGCRHLRRVGAELVP